MQIVQNQNSGIVMVRAFRRADGEGPEAVVVDSRTPKIYPSTFKCGPQRVSIDLKLLRNDHWELFVGWCPSNSAKISARDTAHEWISALRECSEIREVEGRRISAVIDEGKCFSCRTCEVRCPSHAIEVRAPEILKVERPPDYPPKREDT